MSTTPYVFDTFFFCFRYKLLGGVLVSNHNLYFSRGCRQQVMFC